MVHRIVPFQCLHPLGKSFEKLIVNFTACSAGRRHRGSAGLEVNGQQAPRQCLGPLIKRCTAEQTEQMQQHVSEQKNKESESSRSCWMRLGWGVPVAEW
jgi:hypothetical protein